MRAAMLEHYNAVHIDLVLDGPLGMSTTRYDFNHLLVVGSLLRMDVFRVRI